MKARFTWLGIVAACILGISTAFVSCENDLGDGHITYKGRVVSQTANQPMADVTVRITNGTVVRASMMTQADGVFSLSVVVREIDETYYLELLDKNGQSKKGQLRAFGMAEYDYGDIPFGDVVPMVETIGLTAMSENSFTCKCNVRSQGNARVTERGLCWGTNIPSIDDHKIVSGSGMGEYSCVVENAGININTTTYYARAYAINEYGVAYGDPVEINSSKLAYYSLPSMQYGGYTYHIHPDLGGMTWEQGNTACENLVAYGYDDWYLPNKEELLAIAENSIDIVNNTYEYWSSSKVSTDTNKHYYIGFGNYSQWWASKDQPYNSNVYHVIPVRKD